ncbi:GNAT family protein [Rufibacter soli]
MEPGIEQFLACRKNQLAYYSPFGFMKVADLLAQFEAVIQPKTAQYGAEENKLKQVISIKGQDFVFLYEYLPWDSQFFNRRCYRLFTVLYSQENAPALVEAVQVFKSSLQKTPNCYCTAEIPAEDIFLIQCLNEAGLRLVETRAHYYRADLQNFTEKRELVRTATLEDIPILSRVAATCPNAYDRLHADYTFAEKEADQYLATYAASAVRGFCDQVLVPNQKDIQVASFIAFNLSATVFPNETVTFVKIALAAVGIENRGWLVKLLSEAVWFAKENKAAYVIYPTQITNKAAIRTCEKLGFRYGQSYHLLAFSSN